MTFWQVGDVFRIPIFRIIDQRNHVYRVTLVIKPQDLLRIRIIPIARTDYRFSAAAEFKHMLFPKCQRNLRYCISIPISVQHPGINVNPQNAEQ